MLFLSRTRTVWLWLLLTAGPYLPWPSPPGIVQEGSGLAARADDDDDDGDDDGDDRPAVVRKRPAPVRHIVAAGLTPAQLERLRRQGYQVLDQRTNSLLNQSVVLLQGPPRLRDPLARVRAQGPNVQADFNHLYRANQARTTAADHHTQVDWGAVQAPSSCARPVPIGLIDTRVDVAHPLLAGARIEVLPLPAAAGVMASRRRPSSAEHGTAVASLLVGQSPKVPGLVPQARVLAVDAFHRDARGVERMDAWDAVAALDLAAGKGAQVINMSFAGPHNQLLERAIHALDARGVLTVAAVGNQGPAAGPQYPAAYAQVLAVTAVDTDGRAYRRAGRGTHVDLAAPGVNLPTAGPGAAPTPRTGTSFAAPFVTAAAALMRRTGELQAVKRELGAQAYDLGTPGRDSTFGHGLLRMTGLCGAAPPRNVRRE